MIFLHCILKPSYAACHVAKASAAKGFGAHFFVAQSIASTSPLLFRATTPIPII
jgi:hypothetical protein